MCRFRHKPETPLSGTFWPFPGKVQIQGALAYPPDQFCREYREYQVLGTDPEVRFHETGPLTLCFVWYGIGFSRQKLRNTLRFVWGGAREYPEKPGKRVFSGCFPALSLCPTEALVGCPRVLEDPGTMVCCHRGVGRYRTMVPMVPWYHAHPGTPQ